MVGNILNKTCHARFLQTMLTFFDRYWRYAIEGSICSKSHLTVLFELTSFRLEMFEKCGRARVF